jgi:hypothetical protein
MVNQKTHSLWAITFAPHLPFRQADTYIGPFGLLIQMVVVYPANVLTFNSIDLPAVTMRGRLSSATLPFLESFSELLSTYALERFVRLVVVVTLFQIQPTEEVFIVGTSPLIS